MENQPPIKSLSDLPIKLIRITDGVILITPQHMTGLRGEVKNIINKGCYIIRLDEWFTLCNGKRIKTVMRKRYEIQHEIE